MKKLTLNVFLKVRITEVVCPRCEELVDAEPLDAAEPDKGLVADCGQCEFKAVLDGAALEAALPRYGDASIPIEIDAAADGADRLPPLREPGPPKGAW